MAVGSGVVASESIHGIGKESRSVDTKGVSVVECGGEAVVDSVEEASAFTHLMGESFCCTFSRGCEAKSELISNNGESHSLDARGVSETKFGGDRVAEFLIGDAFSSSCRGSAEAVE